MRTRLRQSSAWVIGLVGFAALFEHAAHAGERVTLSGRWQSSPMQVQRMLGEWDRACGEEPAAPGSAGGPVTIEQRGSELSISGVGRNYSTSTCWEKLPGLTRTAHSAGARAWSSVCTTGDGAPRRATVRTTITATDTTLHFDEAGLYQFEVDGQNCTASSRRTQRFTLVQRAGDPEPVPLGGAALAPAARGVPNCSEPSEAARLEIEPQRRVLRVGEQLSLEARAKDAQGCLVPSNVTFRLAAPSPGVELSADGTLHLSASAHLGQIVVIANAGALTQRTEFQIASAASYESLLAAAPSTIPAVNLEAHTNSVSALVSEEAIAEDTATRRKYWFAGIVTLLALALGVLGVALMRGSRRMQSRTPIGPGASPLPPEHPLVPLPTPRVEAEPPRPGAPPPAVTARADAPQPLAARSPAKPSSYRPPPHSRKVCPACGSTYGTAAEFCGKDGSGLVLTS